jgi:hypothetical protein
MISTVVAEFATSCFPVAFTHYSGTERILTMEARGLGSLHIGVADGGVTTDLVVNTVGIGNEMSTSTSGCDR